MGSMGDHLSGEGAAPRRLLPDAGSIFASADGHPCVSTQVMGSKDNHSPGSGAALRRRLPDAGFALVSAGSRFVHIAWAATLAQAW